MRVPAAVSATPPIRAGLAARSPRAGGREQRRPASTLLASATLYTAQDIRYLHLQVMPPEQRGREASMTTELYTDLDRSIRHRFGTPGDDARVRRTAAALEANGISVLPAADAVEAKRIVLGLIPDGSHVHHGASQSLEESGIAEEIEKSGRYEPLRRSEERRVGKECRSRWSP